MREDNIKQFKLLQLRACFIKRFFLNEIKKRVVLAPNICVRMLFWWVQSMLYGVSPALLGR